MFFSELVNSFGYKNSFIRDVLLKSISLLGRRTVVKLFRTTQNKTSASLPVRIKAQVSLSHTLERGLPPVSASILCHPDISHGTFGEITRAQSQRPCLRNSNVCLAW